MANEAIKKYEPQDVVCSIRPEEFVIKDNGEGIHGVVKEYTYLGLNTHYYIEDEKNNMLEIIEESSLEDELKVGEKVVLTVKKEKINIFDKEGNKNLVRSEAYEE